MSFTICDLHVLMRIHAWNRAKLAREIQNLGGKQGVQMASAKKADRLLLQAVAFTFSSELSIWGDRIS